MKSSLENWPHRAIQSFSLFFTLTCISVNQADADIVIPSSVKAFHQGDSRNGDGSVQRVIDGSGLSKGNVNDPVTWTHSNTWQDDWQGANVNFSNPDANYIVFDLGSPTANLDTMFLWNVNEAGHIARGTKTFEIFYATNPSTLPGTTTGTNKTYSFSSGGWTQLGGTRTLPQGTGNNGLGPTSFNVSGASGARYIGFRLKSYHSNDVSRVGLSEIAFTTAPPSGDPSVTTLPATTITSNSARIRGNLTELGSSTPTAIIYWGTSDGGANTLGWANAENFGVRTSTGEFFSNLNGLSPNTTYFSRAFATNTQGDAWASSSQTFTTSAALPAVSNIAATNVSGTSATIGGNVTSTGGETPTLILHYGDNDAGTGTWDSQLNLGATNGSASDLISNLASGTTYFFRAAATNSAGTTWASSTFGFTTTVVTSPSITNSAASGINGTYAKLNGEVTDTGGDPSSVTIYYGTSDGGNTVANWQFSSSLGNQTGSYSRLVSNLQPTTTYYFRALAQNVAGSVWTSSSLSFTTPIFVPPTIVINEIHYDEDDKTVRAEFIELFNPSDSSVDLSDYYFSSGIDFTFPSGSTLAAGAYLIVAEDPATMLSHFGYAGALGPFANGTSLKNSGETITLRDPAGAKIDEVDYKLGFPWPTVGDDIGSPLASPSIELINPLLDNDLGGNWRASGFPAGDGGPGTLLNDAQSGWRYRKGTSYPAQDGNGKSWWDNGYDDSADGEWLSGTAPFGYGDGDDNDPSLFSDMAGNYISIFLRKEFTIAAGEIPNSIELGCYYDDGAVVYLNGVEVARFSLDAGTIAFPPPNNFANSHEAAWTTETIGGVASYLVEGTNVIAIQCINQSTGSSDLSIDAQITANPSGGITNAPTPGSANSTFANNAPPQTRQVNHTPESPTSGQTVLITAKITDPNEVNSVSLQYQIVEPGDYFCRYLKFNNNGTANENPRYEDPSEWTSLPMTDDGTGGDALAADSIYSVTLPAALQTNRRLIRYRISSNDDLGNSITVPYADDPQPNFAYFVYDGTPDWSGSIRDGGPSVNFPGELMSSIPTYFLLSTNAWIDDSQFGGYTGSEYLWPGSFVYDGKVYDHMQYRPRGGGGRFNFGKNYWKFDFSRGHRFEARDRYGKRYQTDWNKLNFSPLIQQAAYQHRGEQGLFEGVGFRLFKMAGVPSCETHYNQFYVVDNASATGADQYEGDYYGLFLSLEQPDSQYLEANGLPDGNLFKIENNSGQLKNQGPDQPSDRSDVISFINTTNGNPSAQWWQTNFEVENYFSYRTVVEAIHHYDIAYGKNFYYYHNPENNKFQMVPWDLDLTWANNMYGSGDHPFRAKVAANPAFNTGYQNRMREIMDLLYNTDEGYRLINESVRDVWTPGEPSLVSADRRLWDNNPRLIAKDIYYDISPDNDFSGMIQILKNYIVSRGNWMESNLLTQENSIPNTPIITFSGSVGFSSNDLRFTSSSYSSSTGFGAMEWRISEVYNESTSNYVAGERYLYEIEDESQSDPLTSFNGNYLFSALSTKPGNTYRARVRHIDNQGRASHWSDPLEFTASTPDVTPYASALRITEVHYHPSPATPSEAANGWSDDDFEFIELQNISAAAGDLSDVRFTKGIDFDFPPGTTIDAGAYLLVVNNQTAFESRYGTGLPVVGEWDSGTKLSNGGENIKLSLGAGTAIIEFTYDDKSPWPTEPDGSGFSLALTCPALTLPADHADPLAWQTSQLSGGSPGSNDHLDFATWATENGLGGSASLTADPDGDGLNNLLEYILASDPTSPSNKDLPIASHELVIGSNGLEPHLIMTFRRQATLKKFTYSVDWSSDLNTWAEGVSVLMTSTPNNDGTITETWRSPQSSTTQAKQFMRLRVTEIP